MITGEFSLSTFGILRCCVLVTICITFLLAAANAFNVWHCRLDVWYV